MTAFNVICPFCGKVNRGLYLEETDGWMECENCHQLVNNFYSHDKEGKTISIWADSVNQVTMVGEAGC